MDSDSDKGSGTTVAENMDFERVKGKLFNVGRTKERVGTGS
jgi:hypothetical protein